MKRWLFSFGLLTMILISQPAAAALASFNVIDRASGAALGSHWHDSRRFVAGEVGAEYALEIVNLSGGDLLAVVAVDGINVVSGETAHPDQRGYVIAAGGRVRIDGWRKSLQQTAAFYFSTPSASYAARTDRGEQIGVLGVALFERAPPPRRWFGLEQPRANSSAERAQAPAGAAADAQVGTGHGRREDSPVDIVGFERASTAPAEQLAIWYDSRANLLRRGVIRAEPVLPTPFPGTFVPDPTR
jgi:hypothetical protein